MRKWLVLLTVVVLAAVGVGLATSAHGATTKRPKIAFIDAIAGIEFYQQMICAAQTAATAGGADFKYYEPTKFDVGIQTSMINSIAATHPDAVVVAPDDPVASYAPLEALHKAGVKIVVVDGTLKNTSIAAAEVLSDNRAGGLAAGKLMNNLVGKAGPVLAIANVPGNPVQLERVKGFAEAVSVKKGMKPLPVQYSKYDTNRVASIVSATLQAHPDLVGIFTTAGIDASGVATALKEAGKTGTVRLITYDALPSEVQSLKAHQVDGLIAQRPAAEGTIGVERALEALNGKTSTPKVIRTGVVGITRGNLSQPTVRAALYTKCGPFK